VTAGETAPFLDEEQRIMGVDYSAFSAYGVKLRHAPRAHQDELDEAIPSKLKVNVIDFGARNYGGAWGLLLVARETHEEADFGRGGLSLRQLPDSRDVEVFARARFEQLLAKAVKYARIHEPPGDWACVECRPHSDMLIAGFQCAIHALRSEGDGAK
jgi:hypothetical protein